MLSFLLFGNAAALQARAVSIAPAVTTPAVARAAAPRLALLDSMRRAVRKAPDDSADCAYYSEADNAAALSAYEVRVSSINTLEDTIELLDDEELAAKTGEFRARLAAGCTEDELLEEAFAVVREAAWRTLELRHYDVQLIGGMACECSLEPTGTSTRSSPWHPCLAVWRTRVSTPHLHNPFARSARRPARPDGHWRREDSRRHLRRLSERAVEAGRAAGHRQRLPRSARCRDDGPGVLFARCERCSAAVLLSSQRCSAAPCSPHLLRTCSLNRAGLRVPRPQRGARAGRAAARRAQDRLRRRRDLRDELRARLRLPQGQPRYGPF